jgi:diadenylate cyclase
MIIRTSSLKILIGLISVGVILLFISILFSVQLAFVVLNHLLVIAAILLRDELKTVFHKIGQIVHQVFSNLNFKQAKASETLINLKTITEIVSASVDMAKTKTGVLIAFEKIKSLDQYKESGTEVNSKISKLLLKSIFDKHSPLHDGAVIIKDNQIQYVGCFFPISHNMNLNPEWGARHRAAIGITEISDAVVLIVSEERGTVHLVFNGNVSQALTQEEIIQSLSKYLN